MIDWDRIESPPPSMLLSLDDLPEYVCSWSVSVLGLIEILLLQG
jgi:hypothetical protein